MFLAFCTFCTTVLSIADNTITNGACDMKRALICSLMFVFMAAAAYAQGAPDVSRACFTTSIADKEPVDSITEYSLPGSGTVYCFTELKGMSGLTVSHVWEKNGKEVYRFNTEVKGQRWRTNSRMSTAHFASGDTVNVRIVDQSGTEYESLSLSIK